MRTKRFFKWRWLVYIGGFYLLLVIIRSFISLGAVVSLLSFITFEQDYGVNILVVGIDDVKSSKRSDAISVVHIDHEKSDVRILSIPRDTRVSVEGVGITKVNHAYAHGGIHLLKSTLVDFLSIPIDGYVEVNTTGIKSLIDMIGGINVTVKEDMKYDDYAANLHIDFSKGEHHLDGEKLLHYVRFRNDSKGDIGRIRRQQEVLKKLFDKAFHLKTLVISPRLISTFLKTVKTDLPFSRLNDYMGILLAKKEQLKIKVFTVPGSVRLINGISYWRPNIAYLDKTIEDAFTKIVNHVEVIEPVKLPKKTSQPKDVASKRFITTKEIKRVEQQLLIDESQEIVLDESLKIEILNGNGYVGVASKTATYLKSKGIKTSSIGNSGSFDYSNSVIVDWKGNIEKSMYLSKLLNIKASNIIVYDRQDKPIDVTLVLGKDWTIDHIKSLYL